MTGRKPHFPFCRRAGCGRLFDSVKGAKMTGFASYLDGGNKTSSLARIEPHPRSASAAVTPERAVHGVPPARRLMKVRPTIVRPVAIFVINQIRPPSFLKGKCYAVGQEKLRPKVAYEIAASTGASEGDFPSASAIPLAASYFGSFISRRPEVALRSRKPSQATAFRIVSNAIAKVGDIGQRLRSHGAVLSRCGQGRALLTQRFRPVVYRRIMLCSQAACRVLAGLTRRRAAEAAVYRGEAA